MSTHTDTLSSTNNYGDGCRLIILLVLLLQRKVFCTSSSMRSVRLPPERILLLACQPSSANPDWWLVIFSSCGVVLWYIKKGTLRFGTFCLSGCLVWCWSLVPGWPSREGELNSCPQPPSHPGSRPRCCFELSATQRASSYRLLSFCSRRTIFHLSPLLFFSFSERCVCFTASLSSHPLPSEVTVFKDGLGSEFTGLRLSSYLLLPDGSFIPYFLFHEVCSLFGHFLQSLCHTHRYNLLIGAIKEVKLQQKA